LTSGSICAPAASRPAAQINRFTPRPISPALPASKCVPGRAKADGTTPGARLTVAHGSPVNSAAIGAEKTK
jgi:hypothetical protein